LSSQRREELAEMVCVPVRGKHYIDLPDNRRSEDSNCTGMVVLAIAGGKRFNTHVASERSTGDRIAIVCAPGAVAGVAAQGG